MNRSLWIGIVLLISNAVIGQSISITVKDLKKEPLIGATVQLLNLKDSTKVLKTTDLEGRISFDAVSDAVYKFTISYIGYQNLNKTITIKSNKTNLDFTLLEDTQALGEVTITGKKPLVTQEDDKMIIDPEPLADVSTNTLEILEKTPGLFVDQDGNIYLNSSTPAVVFINGREQKMSAQDIATILKSLPPNSVQKIEVLRTPSTKYDAASSGGIVNVILKKGVKIGQTGSVSIGMNQGVYGNQFAGANLNNSNNKSTYYVNLNYNHRDAVEDLNSTRYFTPDSILQQVARTRQPAHQGYLGFGTTYDVSPNFELSYDGRINGSMPSPSTTNVNIIQNLAEQKIITENLNQINNNSKFFSFQNDFGSKYKFDTAGSELVTNFSYNLNRNISNQAYNAAAVIPNPSFIEGDGKNEQQRDFLLLQSDLTYLFPQKFKIESGFKSTYQSYRSAANYFVELNNSRFADPIRTNAFKYKESINALYLQASKTFWKDFILKTGVRMEHTYMKGNQTIPSDTSFLINRVDLFPYVYLSRSLFKIATYELRAFLIYRRTINRPGYESLNPFVKYVDQYLYEIGNPALQPQFTDNYEANVSFQDFPVFAVGRNYTNDIFSSVIYQDRNLPNVAVKTFDNLGKNKETYFRITGALPPGGKYFFVAGAQYNLNEYEGFYEGKPLAFSRGSWRFFTFHSLKLSKSTKLTMNGFMLVNGQQNFYELERFGQLNFGLNQQFLDGKLNITLNANDVFRTMKVQFRLNQGSIVSNGDRYSDNQRFGINARYSFGIKKKEEKQNMFNADEN